MHGRRPGHRQRCHDHDRGPVRGVPAERHAAGRGGEPAAEPWHILASASDLLADKAIAGFTVREDNIRKALERNPILVTALNPVIGYELGRRDCEKGLQEG